MTVAFHEYEIFFFVLRLAGLHSEAKKLKRALNVEFDFCTNADNDLPLTVYHEKLDNDLFEMRELFKSRKQKIEECLQEQQILCAALHEDERTLQLDPLPTELEMQDFEMYLLDLKSEKLRRENEISKLKKEIGELCVELELTISESALREYVWIFIHKYIVVSFYECVDDLIGNNGHISFLNVQFFAYH